MTGKEDITKKDETQEVSEEQQPEETEKVVENSEKIGTENEEGTGDNEKVNEKSEDNSEEEKPEKRKEKSRYDKENNIVSWEPKTKLGKKVKAGEIKDIDEILSSGQKILEAEIVDKLLNIQSELIAIGQSKGKFGGGKRRAWRQTQKKTKEGNIPTFSAIAVVGDENGHIGIGEGKAKETLPARDKATRKAKLNLIKVQRGCGGFDCACSEKHSIPFEVTGKAGSVIVKLTPAPQGTGLVVANELKKILQLVGIKDVYSRTSGQKRTTFNLIKACMKALEKTNRK